MTRFLKKFSAKATIMAVAAVCSAFLVGVLALSPAHSFAISNAANEACQGVTLTSGGSCDLNGTQLSTTLDTFINIFSAIVGLVAVIMVIVAGLQFITANANPQNIAKAKSSLLFAIVGLVIVVLAQVIVHFVISQATAAK